MKQSIATGEQTRIERDDVKSVAMTLDDAALDILMKSLTNLYSNPEHAVLREYSSNALDSHIRSGQERPVQITLPTFEKPTLVIEDFGLGLSEAEITDIYSRYGASTKRDSNSQIGAFGLGAKSALAMADRFEIVATKDGITSNAYVKKNSYGVGVIYFESVKATGAPNGVRIAVPVSRVAAFSPDSLTNFFLGWEPNRLDIAGRSRPVSIHDEDKFEALTLAGKTIAWTSGKVSLAAPGQQGLVVNVGGVVYRVSLGKLLEHVEEPDAQAAVRALVGYARALVLNVPIGSVEFTPSREDFIYSPTTVSTLLSLVTSTSDLLVRRVQQDINALTKLGDVVAARLSASQERLPGANTLKYRGQDIPNSFDASGLYQVQEPRYGKGKTRTVATHQGQVALGEIGAAAYRPGQQPLAINQQRALLVKHTRPNEMIYVKSHVYKYYLLAQGMDDTSPEISTWFTTNDAIGDKWADALITETIEFDEYLKIAKDFKADQRPPKEERAKRVKKGDMTMFSFLNPTRFKEHVGGNAYRAEVLTPDTIRERPGASMLITKESKHLAYLAGRAAGSHSDYRHMLGILHHFYPEHNIIIVPTMVSIDSLAKRFPDAVRAETLLQAKIDVLGKDVEIEERDVLRVAASKMSNPYSGVGERINTLRAYTQKMDAAAFAQIESAETREMFESIDPNRIATANSEASNDMLKRFYSNFTDYDKQVEAAALKRAEIVHAYLSRYVLVRGGSYGATAVDERAVSHFLAYVNMVDATEPV